jgi:hypothetical protein
MRLGRVSVIVDVGLLAMLTLLFGTVVIMAMGQLVVVVWVGVPMGAVLPLARQAAMVVGHVVMVMGVRLSLMGVRACEPFTLSALAAGSGLGSPCRRRADRGCLHRRL